MQKRREIAAKARKKDKRSAKSNDSKWANTQHSRGGQSCEGVCVCVSRCAAKGNNARSRRAGTRKHPGTRQTDRKAKSVDDFGQLTSVLQTARPSRSRPGEAKVEYKDKVTTAITITKA